MEPKHTHVDLKSLVSHSPHNVRYMYIHVPFGAKQNPKAHLNIKCMYIWCAVVVRSMGRVRSVIGALTLP